MVNNRNVPTAATAMLRYEDLIFSPHFDLTRSDPIPSSILRPDARTRQFDIRSYTIRLHLADSTDAIQASVRLDIRARQELAALALDFRGMHVRAVHRDSTRLEFEQQPEKLHVILSPPVAVRSNFSLRIDYTGKPADGLIIRNTRAAKDQDHLPVLIYNNPKIPDRSAYILGRGPDPCRR